MPKTTTIDLDDLPVPGFNAPAEIGEADDLAASEVASATTTDTSIESAPVPGPTPFAPWQDVLRDVFAGKGPGGIVPNANLGEMLDAAGNIRDNRISDTRARRAVEGEVMVDSWTGGQVTVDLFPVHGAEGVDDAEFIVARTALAEQAAIEIAALNRRG